MNYTEGTPIRVLFGAGSLNDLHTANQAATGQFEFDGLLIQQIKKSDNFLLLNEGNKKVTAYQIIRRLAGKTILEKISSNFTRN